MNQKNRHYIPLYNNIQRYAPFEMSKSVNNQVKKINQFTSGRKFKK